MKIAVFDSTWKYDVTTPYNEPLGGTQSAIVYFLEEMAQLGHEMYLFNAVTEISTIKNVIHVPATQYINYIKQGSSFDLIIVSCLANELLEIKLNVNNNNTLYCLWTGHDIDQPANLFLENPKFKDMVDLFIFVSEWQQIRYIDRFNIEYNRTLIMRNGIGKPFEKYLDLPYNKIKDSMTYCSIPWRGLDLLQPIYKKIKDVNDSSSLQIYSGLNIYKQDEKLQTNYDELKKMPGVDFNYGIGQEELASKLYSIDYLTYPNIFPETSCITVMQAMACGCIVITSNLGALKETMDNMNSLVNINIKNFNRDEYIEQFTMTVFNYMMLPNNVKLMLRDNNRKHIKQNYIWSVICNKFQKDIINILLNYRQYIMNEHKILLNNSLQYFVANDFGNATNNFNKLKYFPNLNEYYVVKLNLAVSTFKTNNIDIAKKNFKIAKDLKNDFNVNKNIALIELHRGDNKKFIKYAKEALTLEFDCFFANLLAEKLELDGNYHEAIGMYQNILRIEPTNVNCLNNIGNLYLLMLTMIDNIENMMDDTYEKSLKLAIELKEDRKKELIVSNIIFNNLYNWNLSEEQIFKKATNWSTYFPKEERLSNITNKLSREINNERRIRIGYISTDFITHPVGFMFESILKNHNLKEFEIFCYDNSNKSASDNTSKKLRAYNNAIWYNIEGLDDMKTLEIIVNDDLDILVDMMGHTRNTRMNILQYKPARIIVSYFAYPSTNGFPEIDYKISDKYATPPETQKYFVEKLWYLPNGFQCYTPPQEIDGTKNYVRDSKYPLHLACFNNPTKLSIPTIETFANVLKRLPNSKLFLRYLHYKSSYYRECIIRLFVKYGVERERIDIGHEQLINGLKAYNNIDIVLDPFPYNGGTISSEALYMNTPFITLAGTNYVSRVGVSLLSTLGLEKYIANTREEYVDKVEELANNTDELKDLHKNLRNKMLATDLADSVSFTNHMEEAYKNMIIEYKNKK